jgi:hypothetical protein
MEPIIGEAIQDPIRGLLILKRAFWRGRLWRRVPILAGLRNNCGGAMPGRESLHGVAATWTDFRMVALVVNGLPSRQVAAESGSHP